MEAPARPSCSTFYLLRSDETIYVLLNFTRTPQPWLLVIRTIRKLDKITTIHTLLNRVVTVSCRSYLCHHSSQLHDILAIDIVPPLSRILFMAGPSFFFLRLLIVKKNPLADALCEQQSPPSLYCEQTEMNYLNMQRGSSCKRFAVIFPLTTDCTVFQRGGSAQTTRGIQITVLDAAG